MANTNGVAGQEIGQLYTRMANQLEVFVDQSEKFYGIIAALVKRDLVNGAPLTIDRIVLMENHELRIKDPEPLDMPTDTPVSAPPTNGKGEAPEDTIPLAEPAAEEQPSLVEASNGNS